MNADKSRKKTRTRALARNLIGVFRELTPENQAALLDCAREAYGEKKARKGQKDEK